VAVTILFLKVHVTTEEVDKKGQTLLYFAVKYNRGQIAKLLANSGANRESPDGSQQTLLHRAACKNDHIAAGILCDIGAEKKA
jgi:ankyrin repeat protein